MKKLVMAALVAGQLLAAAQPVAAAQLAETSTQRMGAFAGLRLRVPLGGDGQERVRAGVTVAPTLHRRDDDGEARLRFGEGLELGLGNRRKLALSLAGTRLDRVGTVPGAAGPEGPRAGVSTLGWVAIAAGTVVVVGLGVGYLWLEDALDCDDGDDCS